ncbi:uncharacterized protein L201_005966 [Kwoniella dendrophila CBS 6074]|uniref:Ribosomal RNA-processing protein 42 n=1 Tax=Kwoniella dendrophila CBS 6074 TaxID=1295534 RepID=A0AAX4K0F1_9TREE
MSIPITTLSPSEISYIQTSLADPIQPIRSDSRGLFDSREIQISYGIFPHANGSAKLKFGNTEIIAGIKLEVVDSKLKSSEKYPGNESWRCKVEVDITPQSFPSASPNSLSSLSTYLSSIIQSNFVENLKPFEIIKNQKYFQPNLHLTLLSFDGNLLNGLILSSRLAFSDLKLPKIKVISWTGEENIQDGIIGKGDLSGIKAAISQKKGGNKNKNKLLTKGSEDWDLDLSGSDNGLTYMKNRKNLPVVVTLNLVPNSDNIFIDATAQEESACPSKIHLFFNSTTTEEEEEIKLSGIRLEGGQSIDKSRIGGLLEKGFEIAKDMITEMNNSLPQ